MFVAIGIGLASSFASIVFLLSWEDGFISRENKPLATSVAAITLLGVSVFLFTGKKLFNSYIIVVIAFIVVILTAYYGFPLVV